MEEDSATPGKSVMTEQPNRLWKGIAIALALILGVVLICTALIVTGVMKLGLSLL